MKKIYVKRTWGTNVGSDINKLTILGFGGMELMERKVAEKIKGKKWVEKFPPTPEAKATKQYMGWVSKRKKFREIFKW